MIWQASPRPSEAGSKARCRACRHFAVVRPAAAAQHARDRRCDRGCRVQMQGVSLSDELSCTAGSLARPCMHCPADSVGGRRAGVHA